MKNYHEIDRRVIGGVEYILWEHDKRGEEDLMITDANLKVIVDFAPNGFEEVEYMIETGEIAASNAVEALAVEIYYSLNLKMVLMDHPTYLPVINKLVELAKKGRRA